MAPFNLNSPRQICLRCGVVLATYDGERLVTESGRAYAKGDKIVCPCGWFTFWRVSRLLAADAPAPTILAAPVDRSDSLD